ncbi:MAG: hypothetical protein CMF13_01565 [Idiomarina sp.]|jgi:hypothetical protein|nr:hypothetical protein [Blastomonas sp.]MBR37038.1 hypothetical protein [Idiomarina sp.]MCH4895065.1 hypothetical protein [Sphingomonas sp. SFZ2018-12]|tara:strand:- start:330 stop:836 length:507 start_codon:yes stop_codon:yes gene_type:complete
MSDFDIEAIRAEVRAMDFVRGTPAEVAMWREDMAESRANLVIEDMVPTPNDDAFFDMMLDEGVSPPLFIDETWAKTNMTRTHGRSPRGERLLAKVPHGRWRTLTFIAALRHDRITAPIEQMFSKLKTLLRKADERSVEATWRRIGSLLDYFTPDECRNYLVNSGYAST